MDDKTILIVDRLANVIANLMENARENCGRPLTNGLNNQIDIWLTERARLLNELAAQDMYLADTSSVYVSRQFIVSRKV